MSELPRIVDTKRAYAGWNKLDIVTVEAREADGTLRRHKRELVDHGHAAAVLIVDRKRAVALLVRQWRTGLLGAGDPYLLEACAGLIDPGETPEKAARREAEEETGVTVRALRSLGSIVPSAGTLSERIHLFVAEVSVDDARQAGGGKADEGEAIEVVEVPFADLYAMARTGALQDAKTLVIVQRLMLEQAEASR